MKSLERRFKKVREGNSFWSAYVCLSEAAKEQGFSRQAISRWFNKLVPKEDYCAKTKKALIAYLEEVTRPVTTTENEGISPPRRE